MTRAHEPGGGRGWIEFVGLYFIVAGAFNVIAGIAALSRPDVFHEDAALIQHMSFWAWVWFALAVAQVVIGALVLRRSRAARAWGIGFALAGFIVWFVAFGALPALESHAVRHLRAHPVRPHGVPGVLPLRHAPRTAAGDPSRPWEHAGLRVAGGRLLVAGRDAKALAREHGTPLYVYDLQRVAEVTHALQDALGRAGLRHRVRLALKALREPTLLRLLRRLGPPGDPMAIGLDACSPGEVQPALECGFLPEEISYTGTNVSERDLDVIAPPALHINVDLLTQIDRVGRGCPGRAVGLRINPRAGVMRGHAESLYSGARPTKFGIYDEDLEEAVGRAARHGLTIDTAHFRLANGMLDDELPVFARHSPPPSAWCAGSSLRDAPCRRSPSAAASTRPCTKASGRWTLTPTPASSPGTSATWAWPSASSPASS